jgi:hypothetical protein
LSELGGYLLEPEQCQAGAKRISHLLHSQKWEAALIEEYLWQGGHSGWKSCGDRGNNRW